MTKSIYIINPASDFPNYYTSEVHTAYGLPPAAAMGDLAITTVAAMVPEDFDLQLCDESVEAVDFECDADVVAITGKTSQWGRARAIAEEFRRQGKTVIIGGPFASLCPEAVAPYADVLVCGEIEEIAEEIFSDLRRGHPKERYTGTRPELSLSPIPRWDLYPNRATFSGSVQTSRGCPFECEYCDVIAYLGRSQRHKPVENVLRELDLLYQLGYRSVFLADDNLTAYRGRAKELLRALHKWNLQQRAGKMTFGTQVSIDAANDPEMLELLARAGVAAVFIGIETPNEESLREAKKRQNVGIDLVEKIHQFYERGIIVQAGMIVGFDSDGPDIFGRQYEFSTRAAAPITTLGALVAPPATPLYARMKREDRLTDNDSGVIGTPWLTNFTPHRMTSEQFSKGIRWLANKLYSPAAFGDRVVRFIDRLSPNRNLPSTLSLTQITRHLGRRADRHAFRVAMSVAGLGFQEALMTGRIFKALARKPSAAGLVMPALYRYRQIRYMYEKGHFWDGTRSLPSRLELRSSEPSFVRAEH